MANDLASLGLTFDTWNDAIEAAIATNNLAVIGLVRGGQLVQYTDPSGAVINILAVEPFATYVGFESSTLAFAHISMINDVVALCEVVDYNGNSVITLTCNLAQGPLLVDEEEQRWQQIAFTALAEDFTYYPTVEEFKKAENTDVVGEILATGASQIDDPTVAPNSAISFTARVLEAEYRTNSLTNEKFIHATVDGSFAFDVCLPYTEQLPAKDSVIKADGIMTGSIIAPTGCGGGGCGSGSCGCGGH